MRMLKNALKGSFARMGNVRAHSKKGIEITGRKLFTKVLLEKGFFFRMDLF